MPALEAGIIAESDVVTALADFDPVWENLSPREQARIVELLVERVAYDATQESVSVSFRPAGFKAFAGGLVRGIEETAA